MKFEYPFIDGRFANGSDGYNDSQVFKILSLHYHNYFNLPLKCNGSPHQVEHIQKLHVIFIISLGHSTFKRHVEE